MKRVAPILLLLALTACDPGILEPMDPPSPTQDASPDLQQGVDMAADLMTPVDMMDATEDASAEMTQDMAPDVAPDITADLPVDPPPSNPLCDLSLRGLEPTGRDIQVSPGRDTIRVALMGAMAGDRLVLEAGVYAKPDLEVAFDAPVFLEAKQGADVTIEGLDCLRCQNLVFRGVNFRVETVNLDASSDITFDRVTMQAPAGTSVLRIYGQRNGATSNIDVFDSEISGGARTVFILGRFAPSEEWNHGLRFVRNRFTCGTNTCMQVSGGRDLLIADNEFSSTKAVAILTAGATRVEIRRNEIVGSAEAGSAMNIATPGRQWDNFRGVRHMISSEIMIANNLLRGWSATAIQLNAARDIDITHNTVLESGAGLRTNHRLPEAFEDGNAVILQGNQAYRVWNNIFPALRVDGRDPRPEVELHNIIGAGGQGAGLIEEPPGLSMGAPYDPQESSPAIDAGTTTQASGPSIDRFGQPRGDAPDIGALERGSLPPVCP